MNQNDANKLAEHLVAAFAVNLKAVITDESGTNTVLIIPQDLHHNDGFQIRLVIGWRNLQFDLLLGKFAAGYIKALEEAAPEKKQLFTISVQQILQNRGTVNFTINGTTFDPLLPSSWSHGWKQLSWSLKVSPLEINTEDEALTDRLINTWTERFVGSVLALSPLEEIEYINDVYGLPEGAKMQVTVNRYERNRINRSLCLTHHGTTCKVCDFDFNKTYGKVGEGFIHVHHLTPVSQLGTDYVINPIKDLIPVCPNCHYMLHRNKPPLSIDELKKIIRSK